MHIFTIVWQKGTQRLTFSPHKAARADTLVRPYIRVSLCFHEGLSGKITKNGLPPFTSSSISSSRAFFFFSSFFSIIVDVFISGSYMDYSSPKNLHQAATCACHR